MQFVDLAAQQKRIRERIEGNISTVMDHGRYIMGPELKQLEDALKDFIGVKHAIACASGTDAIFANLSKSDQAQSSALWGWTPTEADTYLYLRASPKATVELFRSIPMVMI